ncbi:hypothetical protein [Herbaspirillum huttiense]|uniref:hypothetical protein n=1 Tax=Herbaspirillum huttiense TaxID=863372 RepID=UPI0031E05E53
MKPTKKEHMKAYSSISKMQLLEALKNVADDDEILLGIRLEDIGRAIAAVRPSDGGGNIPFLEFSLTRSIIHAQSNDQHFLIAEFLHDAADHGRVDPIEVKITGKEWATLGLPTASALFEALNKGERQEVAGHKLSPAEDGVWLTNPYGVECGVWQELNLEQVIEFLADMARGSTYGPIPPSVGARMHEIVND